MNIDLQISVTNRNSAFTAIEPKLPKMRACVYRAVKMMPNSTAVEISGAIQKPINEVVARITELVGCFLITANGSKINQRTRQTNTTYTCTSPHRRTELINQEYARLTDEKKQLERDFLAGIGNLTKEIILREKQKRNSQIRRLEKLILN